MITLPESILMNEKRSFPRVACSFPVYDSSFNRIGNAVTISIDGIHVESTSLINSDLNSDLNSDNIILFFLQNQKELTKKKVVVLRIDDFGPDRKLIVYSFEDFSPESDELISNYVINNLWKNVLAPIGKQNNVQGKFISKLDNKKEISNILLEVSKTRIVFYCVQEEGEIIFEFVLEQLGLDTLLFKPNEHFKKSQIVERSNVYLNFSLGYSNYLIYADDLNIKENKLTISVPDILFICAGRSERRKDMSGRNISISIPLPYPAGATLQRKVIDISSKGLAFVNPTDECYFLPGTPIANLKILGRKEFVTRAEIRHITHIVENGKNDFLKVGVFFPEKKVGYLTGDTKGSSRAVASRFIKSGGIFKDAVHCMKALAVQGIYLAQKGMSSRSLHENKPPRVDIIRMKNEKIEEIVGILNTTWESKEKKSAHVIIIPPAFGKRKESTGPLVLALIENFKRVGIDIVIIRYDGIRNLGESYKEAIYRQLGREAIGMTMSQACDDLKTVINFSNDNERFICNKLILLTFSMSALSAMHLLTKKAVDNVDMWIAGMGTPCVKGVLRNGAGGIDYVDNQLKKIPSGEITILGVNFDADNFCQDAIDNKMAFIDDAISAMKHISTPVDWILGEDDAWIDRSEVEMLLDAHKAGKGVLHLLKMGHVPMTGLEGLRLFKSIISILFKALLKKEATPIFPLPNQLDDIRIREWDRTPKYPLANPEKYWAGYLLGEEEGEDEGYDILWECEEYVQFLNDEREALRIEPNHKVADMGCGTGNFGELLIKDHLENNTFLPDLTLVDLVAEALKKVKNKYSNLLGDLDNKGYTFKQCDLEINRLIPVKQFLEGHFYSLDKFKGKIIGLHDDTIELWKEHYSEQFHQILRGKSINLEDKQFLKKSFVLEEINFITDMNLAARLLINFLNDEDFNENNNSAEGGINTSRLKFTALDFGNSNLDFKLPFQDNQFDRILSSIVLSYLKNPDVTFSEFVRCLKPGGRIVVSTMKPDTNMSVMFTNLIKKIEQSDQYPETEKMQILKSARILSNRVSLLFTLVEECQFRFFSKDEMMQFATDNYLKDVTITESYGNPAQAYILTGVK